jgi:pimeloyl-ACP methyl ester carboxylesterase
MSKRPRSIKLIIAALGVAVAVGAFAIVTVTPSMVVRSLLRVQRLQLGFTRRTAVTSEGAIPYLEAGSGPPLVLVHGFADMKDRWMPFAAHLGKDHRILLPDLPGFGEAERPANGDFSMHAQVERLRAFFVAVGVTSADVGGISMGGEIAGVFAATNPSMVRTLALFNSAGGTSDTVAPMAREIERGENPFDVRDQAGLQRLLARVTAEPHQFPAFVQRATVAAFLSHRTDWNHAIDQLKALPDRTLLDSLAPSIRARTLILWGESDQLFHPSIARRLASRIANATLVIVPACGHACAVEKPEEVSSTYLEFLTK